MTIQEIHDHLAALEEETTTTPHPKLRIVHDDESASESNVGMILGIFFGVLILVVLVSLLIFYVIVWRRKKREQQDELEEAETRGKTTVISTIVGSAEGGDDNNDPNPGREADEASRSWTFRSKVWDPVRRTFPTFRKSTDVTSPDTEYTAVKVQESSSQGVSLGSAPVAVADDTDLNLDSEDDNPNDNESDGDDADDGDEVYKETTQKLDPR